MSDKSLTIIKRARLSKGQVPLYAKLVKNSNEGTVLQYEECEEMYLKYGCRGIRSGIPHTYNNYKSWDEKSDSWKGAYEAMTECEIQRATSMWIMHNIGSLVLKGYLKVLPQIEFGKIKIK